MECSDSGLEQVNTAAWSLHVPKGHCPFVNLQMHLQLYHVRRIHDFVIVSCGHVILFV